jgi:hypothetical protein
MSCDNDILNRGLSLALEWGQNWLEPIGIRLSNIYPHLTTEEREAYNKQCKEVAAYGNSLIYELDEDPFKDNEKCFRLYKVAMLENYPWINEENLSKSFSQSCYYAMK